MSENMYCSAQKANSQEYEDKYDSIFSKKVEEEKEDDKVD